MTRISIVAGDVSVEAELNASETASRVAEALPFEGVAQTWGDEVYFEVPVSMGTEPDARADVEVGDIGYWPTGSAMCLFFGPTPASDSDQPRAASPVNVFGELDEIEPLRQIRAGDLVRVTAI